MADPSIEYLRRALQRQRIHNKWDARRFELVRGVFGDGLRESEDAARIKLGQEEEAAQLARARMSAGDEPDVPPAKWISDPYYTGDVEVWPAVKDLFVEVVEGGYNVIVLRGAAGWAKTFLARLLLKYTIHQVGNLRNPHSKIGPMSRAIPLRVALVHISKSRAREELLDPLVTMVQSAGWYRDRFPPQQRVLGAAGDESTYLAFRKEGRVVLRVNAVPTRPESVVGNDLVACHMSECNKYDVVEDSLRSRGDQKRYDAAMALWKELRVRLLTRFYKPLASCVRVIVDSSERYEDDFIAQLVPGLQGTGLRHAVLARSNWQTMPGKNRGPWFWFCKPRKGARAEVVDTDERREALLEQGREVVEVPQGEAGEYLAAARDEPDDFARDAGGWPTDAISRWLRDPEALARCRQARKAWLKDRGVDRDVVGAPERFVQGFSMIGWEQLCHAPGSKAADGVRREGWEPRVLPSRPRFLHVDLADTGDDFVGLAMACVAELRRDGPVLWVDWALRMHKGGDEFDLDGVRELIVAARDHGFWVKRVTTDRYQSSALVQQLRDQGIDAERVSVHAPPDAYDALAAGLRAGRVLVDCGEALTEELTQMEAVVENNRRKVRHRKGGHDDAADALAGAVWQAGLDAQADVGEPLGAQEAPGVPLDERDPRPAHMEGLSEVPENVSAKAAAQARRRAEEGPRAQLSSKGRPQEDPDVAAELERIRGAWEDKWGTTSES